MTLTSPIALELVPSTDSESFRTLPAGTTAIPLAPHPGAFGVVRRHHVHEGLDLYCPSGTEVVAMRAGRVVACEPFTGPAAGSPWWLPTEVVLVQDEEEVLAYGEIEPCVVPGQWLEAGTRIGRVVRVLRHDKGRPTSMLHLERHALGTRSCPGWPLEGPRPATLLDPTELVLRAARG